MGECQIRRVNVGDLLSFIYFLVVPLHLVCVIPIAVPCIQSIYEFSRVEGEKAFLRSSFFATSQLRNLQTDRRTRSAVSNQDRESTKAIRPNGRQLPAR